MKGSDIADALSVNPLAEFALRPQPNDTKVVRVRGLAQSGIPGTWTYTEATDPARGNWYKAKRDGIARAVVDDKQVLVVQPHVCSRDLCTVEDAERAVKERIEQNAAQFAANVKLDRIVDTLQGHGVEARRALGGVLVRDTAALGRLLARLS